MISDPYLDPDTWVLRNKFGIKDRALLREREDADATARLAVLSDESSTGALPSEYGWPLLSAIHRALFSHVYDWAGELRTVGIAKDESSHFAPPLQLEADLAAWEGDIANFAEPTSRDDFTRRLARLYRTLNHIHPFREGNGRAQRAFWELFCLEFGYELLWDLVEKRENDEASRDADRGLLTPLESMLSRIVVEATPDPA